LKCVISIHISAANLHAKKRPIARSKITAPRENDKREQTTTLQLIIVLFSLRHPSECFLRKLVWNYECVENTQYTGGSMPGMEQQASTTAESRRLGNDERKKDDSRIACVIAFPLMSKRAGLLVV
jgi:hypothetical protein